VSNWLFVSLHLLMYRLNIAVNARLDRIPPGRGCLSLMSVVCCHVEVSELG
jgi:hypothetical protein